MSMNWLQLVRLKTNIAKAVEALGTDVPQEHDIMRALTLAAKSFVMLERLPRREPQLELYSVLHPPLYVLLEELVKVTDAAAQMTGGDLIEPNNPAYVSGRPL